MSERREKMRDAALQYHRHPKPGKFKISPTKALTNHKELSLAYSPGVAAASELIHEDPAEVANMTVRGNLVAVVTNGTAVLGLGNIGPLAAKPVMEGKGVLFKKFADIDVFDIEIDEEDPQRLVEIIRSLEPTFGGINLEDIKAPECFEVEAALKDRLSIPVFHDDQHGTAIITAAAVLNGLHVVGKEIADARLVTSGAGAAGIACLDQLVSLGLRRENIMVCDRHGVVYQGREEEMDERKRGYARDTDMRTLADAVAGADIFLGVSVGGVLTGEMVESMAAQPIILALANPEPEILPEDAKAARADAIIATGRSDYPNQVNNVLCFPYMFRGALDVGATSINEEMKAACVTALAELARMEVSDVSSAAYDGERHQFGPEYLIPKPFDPRLLVHLAPAVAKAAMDSGVATRPLEDLEAYTERLSQFVFRSGLLMKKVFDAARDEPKRVIYAEGEEEVVLSAVQQVVDDGLARPTLIGRPKVIDMRIERLGLRLRAGRDFELINPDSDPRFRDYWSTYHGLLQRQGVTPDIAKALVRTRNSVIGALAVYKGDADALLGGVVGRFRKQLKYILDVLGLQPGVDSPGALSAMTSEDGTYFICDTHVNPDPTAEQVADITLMAADKVRLFGIEPKIALLSHSSFGSHQDRSAEKMQRALQLLRERAPDLEVEGEMSADVALSESIRQRVFPNSRLSGAANVFVMPDLDAAHIAFNFARVITNSVTVGPILLGAGYPAHVLTPSATVRRIVNMTAIAVVDAQNHARSAACWRDSKANNKPSGEGDGSG